MPAEKGTGGDIQYLDELAFFRIYFGGTFYLIIRTS
jgi:hypothetical protein